MILEISILFCFQAVRNKGNDVSIPGTPEGHFSLIFATKAEISSLIESVPGVIYDYSVLLPEIKIDEPLYKFNKMLKERELPMNMNDFHFQELLI